MQLKKGCNIAFVFVWIAIVSASFDYNKVAQKQTNVITWDVYGYYLYLPAVFIYHDTKHYDFVSEHLHQYKVSSDIYQVHAVNDSLKVPIYTMGMAVLYSPFFFAADIYCRITNHFLRDGLSFPYQFSIVVASWFYVFIGLYFLRRFLLRYFSGAAVCFTLLGLCFGTNYFHYAAFESGMPHAYIFALYSFLLFAINEWYKRANVLYSILIGIFIALACICRPSEIVFTGYFLLVGVFSLDTLKKRINYFADNWRYTAIIVLAAVSVVAVQIIFWKLNFNKWYYNAYAADGHYFDFAKPHLIDGFFSYRKGWLVYSPLISFAVVGLFFLNEKLRKFRLAVLLFFVANCYIVFSWHIWWYASSFGARAVVQSYAVLSIPFAAFIDFTLKRKALKYITGLLFVFCIVLNHFQDWQYRKRILPFDETTKAYYWKVFGKTTLPKKDLQKYIDVNEVLPTGKYDLQLLASRNFAQDSNSVFTENKKGVFVEKSGFSLPVVLLVASNMPEKIQKQWVVVEADLLHKGDAYGQWSSGYLCFSVERGSENLKWVGVRFQHFIPQNKWESVRFETQLPDLKTGDILKAYIWNQSPDSIAVNNIALKRLIKK